MSDPDSKNSTGLKAEQDTDLETGDDDSMDAYLDEPINTGEYLKLLVYCVLGLVAVGLALALFSHYVA